MTRLPCIAVIVLLTMATVCSVAQPWVTVRSGKPVTCAVSCAPESVAVEAQAAQECRLEVWTGMRPHEAYLDERRVSEGWSFAPDTQMVSIAAGSGRRVWELALGDLCLRGPTGSVPVSLDGKAKLSLTGQYEMEELDLNGVIALPLGLYDVAISLPAKLPAGRELPTLRVGDSTVDRWEIGPAVKGGKASLRSAGPVLARGKSALQLTWLGHAFYEPPLRAVLLTTVARATDLSPVEAPTLDQPGTIIIEAEDIYRQGGGEVSISKGEYADQHGGASLYNFGPGQWVEWRFEVPQAGKYALYARTATQADFALRGLEVDAKPPFPGAALLRFPGTGGWAREEAKQWVWTPPAGAGDRPPLEVAAGHHRLRLAAFGEGRLNLDLFALVPVR